MRQNGWQTTMTALLLVVFLYFQTKNLICASMYPSIIAPTSPGDIRTSTSTSSLSSSSASASTSTSPNNNTLPTQFDGVFARAFPLWPPHWRLPCFPAEETWYSSYTLRTPAYQGFLFVKPMKTGGSTAVGVHLRIARNVARKQQPMTYPNMSMCQTRHDHSGAAQLGFAFRDRQQSFLWTILRDPTSRAISEFFHFEVSRNKVEPTDANFIHWIRYSGYYDIDRYYLRVLGLVPPMEVYNDPIATANHILQNYDFIGITERMEESMVVLQLLLNVTTADILYLNAKNQGRFDDGGFNYTCVLVQPSYVSPGLQNVFRYSEEWHNMTYEDTLLYQAANRSLDLTIDHTIGRERFDVALRKFRHAQRIIYDQCSSTAIYPCSPGGVFQPELAYEDCLWHDSGCGTRCIDQLVAQNEEWQQESIM